MLGVPALVGRTYFPSDTRDRRRRAQRTHLADPLRERPVDRRPHDHARRAPVRSHRRDAARLSRRAATGIRERVLDSRRQVSRESRPSRIAAVRLRRDRRPAQAWSNGRTGASSGASRHWTDRLGTSRRWPAVRRRRGLPRGRHRRIPRHGEDDAAALRVRRPDDDPRGIRAARRLRQHRRACCSAAAPRGGGRLASAWRSVPDAAA